MFSSLDWIPDHVLENTYAVNVLLILIFTWLELFFNFGQLDRLPSLPHAPFCFHREYLFPSSFSHLHIFRIPSIAVCLCSSTLLVSWKFQRSQTQHIIPSTLTSFCSFSSHLIVPPLIQSLMLNKQMKNKNWVPLWSLYFSIFYIVLDIQSITNLH